MRNLIRLLPATALAAFAAVAADAPSANPNPQSNVMAKEVKFQKTQQFEARYLLSLPQNYDAKSTNRWPLLLFLHGAGERGTDIWKVATHGPPKLTALLRDYPFIVVSPQCPEGRIWSDDLLLGLLDEVEQTYRVDSSRVYLTGLSMGGYGTWSLGVKYPERFAAIVPICGGGDLISVLLGGGEKAAALKTLGVWAFHGGKDPVVPTSESQRMVDRLKAAGVQDIKLTIYPDAGHDSWTETYKNPELYDWLLKHQRKDARK
jgi:predicted peptidase